MVLDGNNAFVAADGHMATIQEISGQIDKAIVNLVLLLRDGTIEDIETYFAPQVEELKKMATKCAQEGEHSKKTFETLCGLARALLFESHFEMLH